jgi:hypothetical protein
VTRNGIEYHWIITLTGTLGPERAQATVGDHGLVTRDPKTTTRMEICNELVESIRAAVLQRTGLLLEDYNITYFQLEPNQL